MKNTTVDLFIKNSVEKCEDERKQDWRVANVIFHDEKSKEIKEDSFDVR